MTSKCAASAGTTGSHARRDDPSPCSDTSGGADPDELAGDGIQAAVVDPRTLKPLDDGPILERVKATGRVLLVQEAPRTAGFMAEVAARVAESDALNHLLAPVTRLCGLDAPIPYNPDLERASVP